MLVCTLFVCGRELPRGGHLTHPHPSDPDDDRREAATVARTTIVVHCARTRPRTTPCHAAAQADDGRTPSLQGPPEAASSGARANLRGTAHARRGASTCRRYVDTPLCPRLQLLKPGDPDPCVPWEGARRFDTASVPGRNQSWAFGRPAARSFSAAAGEVPEIEDLKAFEAAMEANKSKLVVAYHTAAWCGPCKVSPHHRILFHV
jgi:hypothetical protein